MKNILQEKELEMVSGGATTPLDHIIIRSDLCVKCNVCVDFCTSQAIRFENGIYSINQNLCSGCGICANVCSVGAIRKESHT